MYTVAITKSGQMTLPKELRIFLGVDGMGHVTIEKLKDEVVIKKRMSDEEFVAGLDAIRKKHGASSKKLPDAVDAVRAYREGKIASVNAEYAEKYT
ncbi:AbrB/MazE/SpoVT family DNA-binding domain-containing protein [Candidatus Saccharibacteria bacterium]|nr:AbrB/MazE/SpoVT family DNA-binding domain-containing protein [Candidatus Saccharibacteria bacterium]